MGSVPMSDAAVIVLHVGQGEMLAPAIALLTLIMRAELVTARNRDWSHVRESFPQTESQLSPASPKRQATNPDVGGLGRLKNPEAHTHAEAPADVTGLEESLGPHVWHADAN